MAMNRFVFLFLPLLLSPSSALAQAQLRFQAPDGWRVETASSEMRVGQYILPRSNPDDEDAELVVYFFGGAGGSIEANLARWTRQIEQPDGRDSRTLATTAEFSSNGLDLTTVDLTGTYVAEVRPGSAEYHDKQGYRLIAAVVETPGGPYFVKLIGPADTVKGWESSVRQFLRSFAYR